MHAPTRYRRAKALFLQVAPLDDDARSAFLDEHCAGDNDLRAEVERLLAHDASEPGAPTGAEAPSDHARVGRDFGRYRIQRLIATGGMGAVYEARQDRPRRTVALKLMRAGLSSRTALRRFEYEAEILGKLRHPGIAQIYEAGTHDDPTGPVPYFAMEYVAGAKTLTEHASECRLGTRQRLELFARVCDAVYHGHQHGIIHRDLKPSNILVDSSGQPKVIDFGVARFTNSDVAVTTVRTDVGQIIGTVQYMSPEQCLADPSAIDVRSDVYSLGVVLYELLCGRPPYDVRTAPLHEATRTIRERAPQRPSRTESGVRGDPETIVLKALEKDPARRYRSAAELADDIRRYLAHEPILARPASISYHVRTLVRRHPAPVLAVSAVVLTLVGATIVSGTFARLEARQRRRAEAALENVSAVVDYQQQMLMSLDPERFGRALREELRPASGPGASRPPPRPGGGQARGATRARPAREAPVRSGGTGRVAPPGSAGMAGAIDWTGLSRRLFAEQIFEPADEVLEETFRDRPLVRARLLLGLGRVYMALGMHRRALHRLRGAHELFEAHADPSDERAVEAILALAGVHYEAADLDAAAELFDLALDRTRRGTPRASELRVEALVGRGSVLRDRGGGAGAERMLRGALDLGVRALGEKHGATLGAMSALSRHYLNEARYAEAEAISLRTLQLRRDLQGDRHPDTIDAINDLGLLYARWGRLDTGERMLREAYDLQRSVRGAESRSTLVIGANLAELLVVSERYEEAEGVLSRVIRQGRRTLADHWLLGRLIAVRGDCMAGAGRATEAEEAYLEAYDILAGALGSGHERAAEVARALAALYAESGRADDAAQWRRRGVAGG